MACHEDGDLAKFDFSRFFRYFMTIQFLGRLFPFIVNIYLLRRLGLKEFTDISGVKFEFTLSLIFAVSRHGIRRACMRADIQCSGPKQEENAARLLKVAWISFPCGLVCTLAAFIFHRSQAFLITGIACMLELLAEPVYILAQNMLLLEVRLVVETVATIVRCVAIVFVINDRITAQDKGNIIALSQALYGATLVIGYWGYFLLIRKFKFTQLVPFRMRNAMNRDRELSRMCALFTIQSIGMFLLLEGLKKVLMRKTEDKSQAVYVFVEKLGSLVVRLVFFPIEESSYSMFAKLASGTLPHRKVKLGHSLEEALKIIMLIGLVLFPFGLSYSYPLLRLLYGKELSDHKEAPTELRCYSLYVIILAINGTSEAFLHAVADQRELMQWSYKFMPMCLIINIVLNALLFSSIQAVGLVIANSISILFPVNMYSVDVDLLVIWTSSAI